MTRSTKDTVVAHHEDQFRMLPAEEMSRRPVVATSQAEDEVHGDHPLFAGARHASGFPLIYTLVRSGCRVAIARGKRI